MNQTKVFDTSDTWWPIYVLNSTFFSLPYSRALVTDPVPIFPQPSETHLNYLKPGSREVLHRPYHIYDYLPPMYPEMEGTEDTNMTTMATNLDDNKVEIKTEAPAGETNF